MIKNRLTPTGCVVILEHQGQQRSHHVVFRGRFAIDHHIRHQRLLTILDGAAEDFGDRLLQFEVSTLTGEGIHLGTNGGAFGFANRSDADTL